MIFYSKLGNDKSGIEDASKEILLMPSFMNGAGQLSKMRAIVDGSAL